MISDLCWLADMQLVILLMKTDFTQHADSLLGQTEVLQSYQTGEGAAVVRRRDFSFLSLAFLLKGLMQGQDPACDETDVDHLNFPG